MNKPYVTIAIIAQTTSHRQVGRPEIEANLDPEGLIFESVSTASSSCGTQTHQHLKPNDNHVGGETAPKADPCPFLGIVRCFDGTGHIAGGNLAVDLSRVNDRHNAERKTAAKGDKNGLDQVIGNVLCGFLHEMPPQARVKKDRKSTLIE